MSDFKEEVARFYREDWKEFLDGHTMMDEWLYLCVLWAESQSNGDYILNDAISTAIGGRGAGDLYRFMLGQEGENEDIALNFMRQSILDENREQIEEDFNNEIDKLSANPSVIEIEEDCNYLNSAMEVNHDQSAR